LLWAREENPLKTIFMDNEAGIILMHQPKNPLRKERLGLLMEPLLHRVLDVFF
jgi:hypothetical protein